MSGGSGFIKRGVASRWLTRSAIVLLLLMVAGIASIIYLRTVNLTRAGAIERLLPTVVRITARSVEQIDSRAYSPGATKVLENFGAGFIIDRAGYIVTNRHLITNAYEIIVYLSDDTPLRARLIGHGDDVDLALLRVDTENKLQQVTFSKSGTLSLGEEVVVIGNPFGLGLTVTSGIISALNRDLGYSTLDSFIQTDAPINHGNSGGPVFNMKGQVVGVSTAYYSGDNVKSGSIGIGFAIPSETTQGVVAMLRKYGHLRIGWIGIEGTTLTGEMRNALGLNIPSGALIADIVSGSPADGILRSGDVVTDVGDARVKDMPMLRREVATAIGKPLRFRILRGTATENVSITPVEWRRGSHDMSSPMQPARVSDGVASFFGFNCARISEDLRVQFQINPGQTGVVVTEIQSNTPAAKIGLQIGDVVVSVQLQAIKDPVDVMTQINDAIASRRDYVVILVRGRGKYRFLTLPL